MAWEDTKGVEDLGPAAALLRELVPDETTSP